MCALSADTAAPASSSSASREFFGALARLVDEPLFLLDQKGAVVEMSPSARRLLGASDEVARVPFSSFTADSAALDQLLRHARRSLAALPGAFKLRTPQGWVSCRASAFRLSHEEPCLVVIRVWPRQGRVSTFRLLNEKIDELKAEVGRRALAQVAARRQTERFRALVAATSHVVMVRTCDDDVVEDSESWRRFTGQSSEAMRGKGWMDAIHPDDRERVLKARAERGNDAYTIEYRLRRADGGYATVLARPTPIKGAEGEVLEWVIGWVDVTEQREAERALRQSEERTRRLFEANIVGVIFWDIAGRIQDANEAFLTMLGYGREELTAGALSWRALTPPEWQAQDEELVGDLRAVGTHRPVEKEYLRKDGTRVPIILASAFLPDSQEHGVAFVLDISDRKRAERELERSLTRIDEERRTLTQLLEQLPHAILFADARSERITAANKSAQQLLPARAASQSLLVDRRLEELPLVSPRSQLMRALTAGEPCRNEPAEMVRGDGRRVVLEWSTAPIQDGSGRITGAVTIGVDTTERIALERRLREGNERLMAALSASLTGTFRWEPDSGLLEADESLERLLGLGRVLRRRHIFELLALVDLEDRAEVEGQLERSRVQSRDLDLDFRVRRADGAVRWFTCKGKMFLDAAGRRYMTGACKDLTERKAAEEDRERLIHALEKSNQELEQFAYVASHDLKAPLRGIRQLSEWLDEDLQSVAQVPAEVHEKLGLLGARALKLERLIDGVLRYSRSGQMGTQSVELVDVTRLLHELIDILAPPATARVELSAGLPVLETERAPLQQVFLNLLSNALKYGGPSVHITVSARLAPRGFVEFCVSDDGPGIAADHHDRIFGVFQRLSPQDGIEGSGIGLSIVRKAAEIRGGRAWVVSEQGAGASFYFTWPVRPLTAVALRTRMLAAARTASPETGSRG